MKASEARDLSREESKQKVVALAEELFNLRFLSARNWTARKSTENETD
jgi:ribosomal protein L29